MRYLSIIELIDAYKERLKTEKRNIIRMLEVPNRELLYTDKDHEKDELKIYELKSKIKTLEDIKDDLIRFDISPELIDIESWTGSNIYLCDRCHNDWYTDLETGVCNACNEFLSDMELAKPGWKRGFYDTILIGVCRPDEGVDDVIARSKYKL